MPGPCRLTRGLFIYCGDKSYLIMEHYSCELLITDMATLWKFEVMSVTFKDEIST
jgi:hypothetical protein